MFSIFICALRVIRGIFSMAMIFVWATCSAGIAKSLPWPLDLTIQRERLAETKTNAFSIVWPKVDPGSGLPPRSLTWAGQADTASF
jgi:hypothetical protein